MLPYNKSFHIIAKHNIVVIWCAKAACTTVNSMFFTHEKLMKTALNTSDWIHEYRKLYQLEEKANRLFSIEHIPFNRYIQFCVNPYRRAVSSYLHGMSRRYLPEQHKNISFLEFLNRLYSKKIPPNPHHNLQTFFKNNYKLITVVKMEYLNKDLSTINKKFNLHFKRYKNQNIKKKSNKINYFIGNTEWSKYKDTIPDDYTYFYNNRIKRLVEKIYHEDIKHLGYTWDMFVQYEETNT